MLGGPEVQSQDQWGVRLISLWCSDVFTERHTDATGSLVMQWVPCDCNYANVGKVGRPPTGLVKLFENISIQWVIG